jgi:hypothetical protein
MKNDLKKLRGPFTPLYADATRKCKAWYAMDPIARALFVELKLLYNRDIEGPVGMSARQAARLLDVSKDFATKMLKQLQHYGFAVKMIGGHLGPTGKGVATQFRLSDEPYLEHPATLDFKRWDGTLFEEKPHSKKTEPRPAGKDRPVLPGRTPRPAGKDRGNGKTRKTDISAKTDPVPPGRTFLRSSPSSTACEPVAVSKAEPAPASGTRRSRKRR